MDWLILFIIGWIIFILFIDIKEIKKNIWSGVFAVVLQLIIDICAIHHKQYEIHNGFIYFFGSSIIFSLSPIFTMGILLAQIHPIKKRYIIPYILIFSALFSLQEYFLLLRGALVYINWHFSESLFVNTMAMFSLSWFSLVVLDKYREVK